MSEKNKNPLEFVLYFSILILIIGLLVSVFFYIDTFSGGISTKSSDWSALGSFFGGIFSPAVSFVTLMAIIITISLQKKFLESQSSEFTKLQRLQESTLNSQKEHLSSAQDSYEYVST